MDNFLDQAARILASEMPRRQALRRLGGLVAGGLLATFGVKSVEAQTPPPCTGNKVLTSCPGNPGPALCTTQGKCTCGSKKCDAGKQTCCLGVNSQPFCATKPKCCTGFNNACKTDESCCGNKCCKSTEACVDGKCVASPAKK